MDSSRRNLKDSSTVMYRFLQAAGYASRQAAPRSAFGQKRTFGARMMQRLIPSVALEAEVIVTPHAFCESVTVRSNPSPETLIHSLRTSETLSQASPGSNAVIPKRMSNRTATGTQTAACWVIR